MIHRLLLLWLKSAPSNLEPPSRLTSSEFNGLLLATFSIRSSRHFGSLQPPFSHFDPFGTEFREPGRVSHPGILQLQRSFKLAAQFLTFTANRDFTVPTLMSVLPRFLRKQNLQCRGGSRSRGKRVSIPQTGRVPAHVRACPAQTIPSFSPVTRAALAPLSLLESNETVESTSTFHHLNDCAPG